MRKAGVALFVCGLVAACWYVARGPTPSRGVGRPTVLDEELERWREAQVARDLRPAVVHGDPPTNPIPPAAPSAAPQPAPAGPGRTLALLVGVKEYDHAHLPDLEFPDNDASVLGSVLEERGFEVRLLTTTLGRKSPERRPTVANVEAALTELLRGVTKRDVVLVGLSGHGVQPLGSTDSYFCPTDANPSIVEGPKGAPPRAGHPETLVSVGRVLKRLDESGVGHKLLLVDACRTDPLLRTRGLDKVDLTLPARTGVMLSCQPGQYAIETKALGVGHGVFFHAVIEGLRGAAKDSDGEVTWTSLTGYVQKHVPRQVATLFGTQAIRQQPNVIGNLAEPVVLTKALTAPRTMPAPAPLIAAPREGKKAGEVRDDNALKMPLVWCPPGEFAMGMTTGERFNSLDVGQVRVTLSRGFWIGKHEVAQGEWKAIMGTEPWNAPWKRSRRFLQEPRVAVDDVSWDEAARFCNELTDRERRAGRLSSNESFRLPTEAEWEYACRAGTTSRYSFGDDPVVLRDYAWCDDNTLGEKYAHIVGMKLANRWGLHDMHGNAEEWCEDWWSPGELSGGRDPSGGPTGTRKVCRGGSFISKVGCTSAARRWVEPKLPTCGFRVVCSAVK